MTEAITRKFMGISSVMLALWAFFWPTNATALSCTQAAAVAEAGMSMPSGLLLAIGNVESGRPDALGKRSPWPWTLNAGGVGHFFDTAKDAIFAVQSLRANGVQSIDVGCFQINLFHHPNAFPDLVSGFDPLTNALTAARFLVLLHAEFGGWNAAVAAYHSRIDTQGAPYRDRVLAAWHGTSLPQEITTRNIHIWGPTGEISSGLTLSSATFLSKIAIPIRSKLPHINAVDETAPILK